MKCPNCNKEAVFKETLNQNGIYYLECPYCGVHFINNTALKAESDETYFRESYAAMINEYTSLSEKLVIENFRKYMKGK